MLCLKMRVTLARVSSYGPPGSVMILQHTAHSRLDDLEDELQAITHL
jgi:hypothetical protein